MKIVNRNMILAGGIGLVPAPLLGQVAIAGLLGRMLYELCRLYGTRLSGQKTKAVVAAVLGGAHSDWISRYLAKWSDTALPGTLNFTHRLTRPLAGAAITYAIGILFVHHLDTGAWTKKSPQGIPEPRIE